MKKFLLNILILVALVGLFSPAFKVQAQNDPDPDGTCTVKGVLQPGNWKQSNCLAQGDYATWAGPYVFLAPLPCQEGDPGCVGGKLTSFTPGSKVGDNTALSTYLNLMIKIFIGLCAVLAVIMIVLGGIEYMTTELISSKEAGKERITNAIFGLLLALGAWTILNQINPDILKTDLSSLTDVSINTNIIQTDMDSGPPSLSPFTGTPPSGPVAACTAGVTKSNTTGIVACQNMGANGRSIAANVDDMMAAAKAAGLDMWAGGFRTTAQQIALRIQNCNGNTTDASAPCSPATAVPGHSEHESGSAFDVACGGSTITSTSSPCFTWLQANASKYGLQNLKVGNEPWHWSIDGR